MRAGLRRAASVVALLAPATLGAQTFKELSVARYRTDQTDLTATIEFASGRLMLRPAEDRALYRLIATFDPERYVPLTQWLPGVREVRLGVESTGRLGIHVTSGRDLSQAGMVELSPDVRLNLDATLGSTEADLELGGLQLAEVAVRTGASRTSVHFRTPNPIACTSARFTMEATELTIEQLANSRCGSVQVEGGAGTLTLDFSGALPDTMGVTVRLKLGTVTLRLPKGVGVRLEMDRFLALFDNNGLVREGKAYISPGYAQASRRLNIDLRAALGGVKVEWVE